MNTFFNNYVDKPKALWHNALVVYRKSNISRKKKSRQKRWAQTIRAFRAYGRKTSTLRGVFDLN